MFKGTLSLLFALALTGALSQFPEFAQQYMAGVSSASAELRETINGFETNAANADKTLQQAIADDKASGDAALNERGNAIEQAVLRENFLQRHYSALSIGGGYDQLILFAKERDIQITRDTLGVYKPALPLTFTGAAHAAFGFLIGFALLKLPTLFRRRRRMVA